MSRKYLYRATPDVVTPDVATPDVVTPDVATPDVVTPDVVTPDVGRHRVPPSFGTVPLSRQGY